MPRLCSTGSSIGSRPDVEFFLPFSQKCPPLKNQVYITTYARLYIGRNLIGFALYERSSHTKATQNKTPKARFADRGRHRFSICPSPPLSSRLLHVRTAPRVSRRRTGHSRQSLQRFHPLLRCAYLCVAIPRLLYIFKGYFNNSHGFRNNSSGLSQSFST